MLEYVGILRVPWIVQVKNKILFTLTHKSTSITSKHTTSAHSELGKAIIRNRSPEPVLAEPLRRRTTKALENATSSAAGSCFTSSVMTRRHVVNPWELYHLGMISSTRKNTFQKMHKLLIWGMVYYWVYHIRIFSREVLWSYPNVWEHVATPRSCNIIIYNLYISIPNWGLFLHVLYVELFQ